MTPSALRAAAARLKNWTSQSRVPTGGVVPLSALRMRLDEGSASTIWSLNPDGVLGRALLMPAGATAAFPLRLSGDVEFSARAMLLPHDWRDGHGAVRASVSATEPDGSRQELWSGTLRASDRGRPRGLKVHCRIDASSTSVELCIDVRDVPQPLSVARAIWVEPAISDPLALPALAPPVHSSAAPRNRPPRPTRR